MPVRTGSVWKWSVFLIFLLTMGGTCAKDGNPNQLEVKAQGVLASGFLHSAFDYMDQDALIYGLSSGERISVEGKFDTPESFFQPLVDQLQLKPSRVGPFIILSAACTINPKVAYPQFSNEKLSLFFQRIELKTLFQILQDFYDFKIDDATSDYGTFPLAIRGKNLTGSEFFNGILSATHKQLVPGPDGKYRLENLPQDKTCSPRTQGPEEEFEPPIPLHRFQTGPGNRRPEYLELYGVEKMSFKGYFKRGDRLAGLIEFHGLNTLVKNGDYIGKDYGKIIDISKNGMRIREIKQNVFGIWGERDIEINEGQRLVVIGKASYEDLVEEMYAYARRFQETPSLCSEYFPEYGSDNAAALKKWQVGNARELRELEMHVRAYAEREALDEKDAASVQNSKEGTEAFVWHLKQLNKEAAARAIQSMRGGRSGDRRAFCKGFPTAAGNTGSHVRSKFSNGIARLQRCEVDGFCGNLEKFRRF